jgi:hypothetical protein
MGTQGGLVMKWNANVSLKTMMHEPNEKIFGTLYGKVVTEHDLPLPEGIDINRISSTT